MSTKRVSQTIVDAEVKLPSSVYNTQTIVNAEVKFPQQTFVTQALVLVEVLIGDDIRRAGPATQCT